MHFFPFSWETKDVGPESSNGHKIVTWIINLKPYTQYAVYLQSYTTSPTATGVISDITYFRTLPTGE